MSVEIPFLILMKAGGTGLDFFANSVNVMWVLLGIILICFELFLPGGVVGTIGALIVFATILFQTEGVLAFCSVLFIVTLVTGILLYLLWKLLPKNKLNETLFLKTSLTKQEGFSTAKDRQDYLGKEGVSKSVLRPSGKIEIGEEVLDAQSENTYIAQNKAVKVIAVEGNKLIVREMD